MHRLFKSPRFKKTETREAQNGSHLPDSLNAPSVVSETLVRDKPSTAHERSKLQTPSVAAPIYGKTSTIPSNSIAQAQVSIQIISTSQRLWNDAYDSLENDGDTAKLVKAYMKTLKTVLEAENALDPLDSGADDVSTELKDPTKRQLHMKKLLEDGRAKVFKASNITKGVGDVAQFILSAKGLVDLAVQNIPQAALPWAGVCIGLQVSIHPSASKLFPPNICLDPLESCESDKI
jgi:hypothetical protein